MCVHLITLTQNILSQCQNMSSQKVAKIFLFVELKSEEKIASVERFGFSNENI